MDQDHQTDYLRGRFRGESSRDADLDNGESCVHPCTSAYFRNFQICHLPGGPRWTQFHMCNRSNQISGRWRDETIVVAEGITQHNNGNEGFSEAAVSWTHKSILLIYDIYPKSIICIFIRIWRIKRWSFMYIAQFLSETTQCAPQHKYKTRRYL